MPGALRRDGPPAAITAPRRVTGAGRAPPNGPAMSDRLPQPITVALRKVPD